jgi:hypothetical protein
VHAAIETNKVDVGLAGGPTATAAIGLVERFSTDHVRPGSADAIHVRHSFLPFPKQVKSASKSENA